jgi:hypothetical protein
LRRAIGVVPRDRAIRCERERATSFVVTSRRAIALVGASVARTACATHAALVERRVRSHEERRIEE